MSNVGECSLPVIMYKLEKGILISKRSVNSGIAISAAFALDAALTRLGVPYAVVGGIA